MKKLVNKNKSLIATVLGLLSAVATALAVIDFTNFNWKNPNDIIKIFIVAMPVVGGYFTTLK